MNIPFTELKTLEGREPIGAVLTIGRRGPRGNPIDNDRFFIHTRQTHRQDFGQFSAPTRDLHPAFRKFNTTSAGFDIYSEQKEKALGRGIRLFGGVLAHAKVAEVWSYSRRAQRLPKTWKPGNPDNMRPTCEGDGERAVRYMGKHEESGEDIFEEIECPDRLCEFAQGDKPPCGVFARMYFYPRWKEGWEELSKMMLMWETRSWNSASSLKGLMEHVLGDGEERKGLLSELGIQDRSLFGMPFTMSLGRKSKSSATGGRSFPVVDFALDGDVLEDWLITRRQNVLLAGGEIPRLPSAKSDEELSAEQADEDFSQLQPAMPSESQSGLFEE